MKFFPLRMRRKSGQAIEPQIDEQINVGEDTHLEDTPDPSTSPREHLILSSQEAIFSFRSYNLLEDRSDDGSFERPLRRGRDNLSYYEPDFAATPAPSPGMYQCEYPDMNQWEPEKWSTRKREGWENGVERIAHRIDQTSKHDMPYRLAEEIKACNATLEFSIRCGTDDASFDTVKAEFQAAIEEAKQELRAEIDMLKCRCLAADKENEVVISATDRLKNMKERHTM